MKKIWLIVIRSLGWMGIIFLIGASALLFTFASHRNTLSDWIYAVGVIAAFATWMILDRRVKFRKQEARNRALEIVHRLRASGQGLGDASKEELEAILVVLNGDS